ncbi:hypothetical protein HDU98_007674 [Podochytrium sp. JEL0797]|nr:hypothetical protein HDU98_007674 [Podochytrium sp. JEL0797]
MNTIAFLLLACASILAVSAAVLEPGDIPAQNLLPALTAQLLNAYYAMDSTSDYMRQLLAIFQQWTPLNVVGCADAPCNIHDLATNATVSFSQQYIRPARASNDGLQSVVVYWAFANRGNEWSAVKSVNTTGWGYSASGVIDNSHLTFK